ncbi:nucleoside hydrolase [Neorhizobium sp. Rsf11]|uniref:Nucleoside hydrolase n=2 Tax=Neorhizobium TaxID=1525371 RepID=A0ABV0M282_9HYPH|nr:nucleoside hydrolase [Neorhizobium petrolearium]MCC2612048.1 nucleoside hydrolase [Neorhizobium petrolearium]WGI67206.1 nucleoside hydrolase [Neorhizobium petrolearium]
MSPKIIFDTDPGIDDATALLFLNACRNIELLGITTVFGNGNIDTVTRNARYLKRRFSIAAPIARGADRALGLSASPPPIHVHGINGLGDVPIDENDLPPLDPRPAHRFIIDQVHAFPHEVTLLAVGRLTNLALALSEDPTIAKRVKEVVIMGGAFGLAGPNGNVTPVAEANIIGDPHAADLVFAASWPVTAVGLDVTRQVIMRPADIEILARDGGDAGRFIAEISRHYMTYHRRFGLDGFYVHDSTAMAFVLDRSLFETRKGPIRVATDGIAIGQTIMKDRSTFHPPGDWDDAPDQSIATSVDRDGVRRLLMEAYLTPDAAHLRTA